MFKARDSLSRVVPTGFRADHCGGLKQVAVDVEHGGSGSAIAFNHLTTLPTVDDERDFVANFPPLELYNQDSKVDGRIY